MTQYLDWYDGALGHFQFRADVRGQPLVHRMPDESQPRLGLHSGTGAADRLDLPVVLVALAMIGLAAVGRGGLGRLGQHARAKLPPSASGSTRRPRRVRRRCRTLFLVILLTHA